MDDRIAEWAHLFLRTDASKLLLNFGLHVAIKQDGQTVGAYLMKPNSEESARLTIRADY